MSCEPELPQYCDGMFKDPKKCFEHNECRLKQIQYMLDHPEVKVLLSMFVSKMIQNPMKCINGHGTLEAVGKFFNRPASVLQSIADEELAKTDRLGFKPDNLKRFPSRPHSRKEEDLKKSGTPSVSPLSSSIKSVYSEFVTESTSATTLEGEIYEALLTPTLKDFFYQVINTALIRALDFMYETREQELLIDETYLCVVRCANTAVDYVWGPFLEDINVLLNKVIEDATKISVDNRRLKKLKTNKMSVKIDRLRHHFRGFMNVNAEEEIPKAEIQEIVFSRTGTYNRYPKDAFGVYVASTNNEF